ncbi:MAG: hypothetical protein BroJett011_07620 [Chloroflexota bacterium]|nr:MAG: hypothetical protein BroJett011_07620 [Chloroflexota bacterium]
MFEQCYTLPTAKGTIWGQHTRIDLLPLANLEEAVTYAERLVKPSQRATIGFLLGLKVLDEAATGDLRFRLPEDALDDIEAWLMRLAQHFELEQEWRALSLPTKQELQKIVMAWQPYAFLAEVQAKGIFALLATLLHAEAGDRISPKSKLAHLIQRLLGDDIDTAVCVASVETTGLLDIPFLSSRRAEIVGDCQPLVKRLGQCLFKEFECSHTEFLRFHQKDSCLRLVCLPPFTRIKDEDLLAEFDLANRGQGRRSLATEAEILWLEQSHNLLVESGLLVILLTEGFLSNASARFAREWTQAHFKIDTILSLPSALFQPGAAIKTSLVCLRKMVRPPKQYRIFMAELDEADLENPAKIVEAYWQARQEEVVPV